MFFLDVTRLFWMTTIRFILFVLAWIYFWVVVFRQTLVHLHNTFFIFRLHLGLALFTALLELKKSYAFRFFLFGLAIVMGSITVAAGRR